MWNRLSIGHKIPAAILGFALIVGVGVGASSYFSAARELNHQAEERLQTIAESRVTELNDYLESIRKDLQLVSTLPFTAEAIESFSKAWEELEGDKTGALKKAYIQDNPNPLGEKHLLNNAGTGTAYDLTHEDYHTWFRELLTENGYYDIFLFDKAGNLIYSVFKEEDFATNFMRGGQWAQTDLGQAFRTAIEAGPDSTTFFDFQPYAPSNNAPASFISTAVEKDGEIIGALVFQMPIDAINALMNRSVGLGETGETLIVGADHLLRNNTRFTSENDILKTRMESLATETALAGSSALFTGSTYRGDDFIQVGYPVDFLGTRWAVIALKSQNEALAALTNLKLWMLLVGLGLFVVAGFCGYRLALTMTRPLDQVIANIKDLIDGKLDTEVTNTDRLDEIGDMQRAILVFRDNAVKSRNADLAAETRRETEETRRQEMDRIVAQFKTKVSDIQNQLAQQTAKMSQTSDDMVTIAEQASTAANGALQASKGSDESVQASAAAAEQLKISIEEINQHTNRALKIARDASSSVEATNTDVTDLSSAADKIGAVISMIREIAEQTNLLALNATIEAARAGEAGKGFAVVAAEVKELSNQTAKATDQISTQIAGVQSSTHRAVNAIRDISTQISGVEEVTAAIASAVEEQGAATGEISNAITMAAQSSTKAAENVAQLQDNIDQTRASSTDVENLTQILSDVSKTLNGAVEEFLSADVWVQSEVDEQDQAA